MTETILRILLKGGEIFSDERRRSLSKTLKEKNDRVSNEQNKRFPNFNNDRLALAKQDLESFMLAYEKEFGEQLSKVLNKALSND